MSHHFRLDDFAQTLSVGQDSEPFHLPKIQRPWEKEKVRVFCKPTPPKPSSVEKNAGSPLLSNGRVFRAKRTTARWSSSYQPKGNNKSNNKRIRQKNSTGFTQGKDWTTVMRQAIDSETTARRVLVANEMIERQRMTRQVFGSFSDALTDNEEHATRLLAAGEYAGAHVYFSRLLSQSPHSKLARGRRAVCNWYLLHFEDCVEDCHLVLESSQEKDSELLSLLCRSLLLLERYPEAQRWYAFALKDVIVSCSDPYHVRWRVECDAISALRQFRLCAEQARWAEAVQLRDTVKPLVDGTPLVLVEARALLHTDPDAARVRLMPYVPSITRPSPMGGGGNTLEERNALRCVGEHYLHALVLLAQAHAYSGSAHLAAAAAMVRTCLTINSNFGPAVVLGHYLISLEEIVSQVTRMFEHGRYADALPLLRDGLQLDRSNRVMCSALHCLRAEAYAHQRKDIDVFNDCTVAIEIDPKCAKAYLLRAEVLEKMRQRAEAARDRLAAARLNPMYRHILRGDEEQYVESTPPLASQPISPQRTPFDGARRPREDWFRSSEFSAESRGENDGASNPPAVPSHSADVTLYDVLELHHGASINEVRAQFKRLTLRYHPDRVVMETVETQNAALERFKLINHAHEVLSDSSQKLLYDLSIGISMHQ